MTFFKTIPLKIIVLNFIFLLFMSLYRFIFFVYFSKGIDLSGFRLDIFKSFYMGFRFDLSAIAAVNAPPVLLFVVLFIIGQKSYFKFFSSLLKYYYTFFIGTILTLFCIDFDFYSYFKDHLNILVFGFVEDDTLALIKTFYENYNLFLICSGVVFLFLLVFFLSNKLLRFKEYNFRLPKIFFRVFISVVLLFSLFLMIRGSVGLQPIGVYSDISSNTFLNKTAINCLFTLQRAFEHKLKASRDDGIDYILKTGYENDIRQAFADFLDKDVEDIPKDNPEESLVLRIAKNKKIEELKPNVILIVMESFGNDLIKYNSEKFNVLGKLKEHFDKDIVFYNFSSEGSVTITAIEATLLNTVVRPNSICLSQSKYAYKSYPLASVAPYNQNNYKSFFIYGDNTSWRNFGSFALNLGFNEVLSAGIIKKDFPRGPWGVYDEYLFDLVFETLSKSSNGNFIYVLTTTNHPPYTIHDRYSVLPLEIPDSLKNNIQDMSEAKKRFASYQYSNEMLGRFISKVKSSKYASNTIIAVTGDHNFNNYNIENFFDSIRVPFYLYVPNTLKPKEYDNTVFGCHLDIMPTLYNLSLSDVEYMSEGKNLFSKKSEDHVMIYGDYIFNKNYAVCKDIFSQKQTFYTLNNSKLTISHETNEHKKLLKKFLSMVAISDYLIRKTGK
ncbi:MAG: sulfatase-like hydrolase/transferase [Endomicrobium sp.]|jgi:phosphoglycerol transferase MdoB-like AlkP superfamily enzyme|nr:sulfatase-like hydrolase/transferase [Endomicrobium sp.]